MIKLIAIDMDGTLLDSCKQLPAETVKIFQNLLSRDIRIVIASGRQYASLEAFFPQLADQLVFVSENGSLIRYNGATLFVNPIPTKMLDEALRSVRLINHHFPLFSGVDVAYLEDTEPEFCALARSFYLQTESVVNLEDIIGKEPICKIAVYNPIEDDDEDLLFTTIKDLQVVRSNNSWVDIGMPDSSKETALRYLQDYFNVTPAECMAFGDYDNDIGMFSAVEESYAVANATAATKAKAKHICQSNDEHGVLKILKRV